ncbi:MAG TPA: ABC transporter ATP-binding protein [Segeticoccus sp.]|uniref:ABC transporter ATP-binding protein n=1 Tax=Segeticoccus sp. TaxID=2706531 RepID=UPI002D80E7CA|nr:ABC transporter ATP-binding protein [Segeticoccus sp.]HET8600922.1 ABC transporter ATP-binding protein [Segeticoccus sp.]
MLRRYVLHARLLWRASPLLTLTCTAIVVAQALASTAVLLLSGRFVGALAQAIHDGPSSPAATTAWHSFIAVAVVLVAEPVLAAAATALAPALTARYLVLVTDGLAEACLAPHGIAHLEEPETASRLQALVQASRDWTFVTGCNATWQMLGYRLSGVGAFVVLATWRWWVPFVLLAGWLVLGKSFSAWIATAWDNVLDVSGNDRRHATYLRSVLLGDGAAKEIRLFGLAGWLTGRYRSTWLTAMKPVWHTRTVALRPVIGATVVLLGVYVIGYGLIARDAWTSAIGIGTVAAMVQAAQQMELFGPVGDIQTALGANTSTTAQLASVRAELGLPGIPARSGWAAQPRPLPEGDQAPARARRRGPSRADSPAAAGAPVTGKPAEIVFAGVGFRYPTRTDPVFEALDLHVPPGQSIAVVGVNGAGKSTLIKLLCGLYAPTAGRVCVDGADPATDDRARRRVAVIFQDFVRYHLSLRDNVRLTGAGMPPAEPALLQGALADAAAEGLLDRLEHGWDTVLSAGYTGGTDLSGGQWQRIALARALASLADGAGVLVLDEPTAALDVRAEAALFDHFLEVTRGMTTVLVSHRLSSVRHADRIVVIDEGRIVEDGSHEDLMARGGEYAQMFALQAARFRAGHDGPDEGAGAVAAHSSADPVRESADPLRDASTGGLDG